MSCKNVLVTFSYLKFSQRWVRSAPPPSQRSSCSLQRDAPHWIQKDREGNQIEIPLILQQTLRFFPLNRQKGEKNRLAYRLAMLSSEPLVACNRRPHTTPTFQSIHFFCPSPLSHFPLSTLLLPKFLLLHHLHLLPLCDEQTSFVSCFQLLGAQLQTESSPALEAITLAHLQMTLRSQI